MKATIPLAIAAFLASPAYAQIADARRWTIYGATSPRERDANVPGGAVLKLPQAIAAGEPVSASFRARAARPMRTTAPGAVDLTIPSKQATLAGTLHLPTGRGPFPVAIVIQGHGPNGRGGFGEVIARLNRDGIAALEYDKRGIGRSTGTYVEDLDLLTADAQAAVACMRARPDIDGRHIALIGHSQGGVVAPAVAAADPSIGAVVTLGGSVGDGYPYVAQAIRRQMLRAGRPEAAVDPAVDAIMALIRARGDGLSDAAVAPLRAAVVERFVSAGFTRQEAEVGLTLVDTPEAAQAKKLRAASDLSAMKAPVLALFGGKDPLVIAAPEAAAARTALAANPRARVVVFDDLSHWFQDGAVTGGDEEVAKLGPNIGSPRVVTLVGDFVRDALKLP